ncbi:hypothetical protein [Kribbella sp. NPDC006257]|uniref:hypothetical protein n=1 Tax=Kribbella sp. NPDC006257 TaxID=3156738 RepID=UPI0033AA8360
MRPPIERRGRTTSRTARAWQGIAFGAVMIIVGVVLLANEVPFFGFTALPIVSAGCAPLTIGLYQLAKARHERRKR